MNENRVESSELKSEDNNAYQELEEQEDYLPEATFEGDSLSKDEKWDRLYEKQQ